MTGGLKALIPIVFLSAVAFAHAQGPDRRLAVYVTAAPIATDDGLAQERQAATAAGRREYETVSLEDLAGSVEDVKRAVEGAGIRVRRKHLTLVDSAADAHFIVELRSRRSSFGTGGLVRAQLRRPLCREAGLECHGRAVRGAATWRSPRSADGPSGRAGVAVGSLRQGQLEARRGDRRDAGRHARRGARRAPAEVGRRSTVIRQPRTRRP